MNEAFPHDPDRRQRMLTNQAYRETHGLHGTEPVHYGARIVVDEWAPTDEHCAAPQPFVRVYVEGRESDAVAMSFTRFVPGVSDVYVYPDVAELLRCCGCRLVRAGEDDPRDFWTILVDRMIVHLAEHTSAGHLVPDGLVSAIRDAYPGGMVPQTRGEHGGFSLCPADCPLCEIVVHESELHWRERVGVDQPGSGLVTFDRSRFTAEQLAEMDGEDERQVLADAHLDAAGGYDPDYGRDLDDEDDER